MNRRSNHRDQDHRNSFFEPLEDRRLMSAGTLDPSFSTDGKANAYFGIGMTAVAKDVAVQADGKTVVVGQATSGTGSAYRSYFAVARFNVDGTPDRTFGPRGGYAPRFTDGTVLTTVGTGNWHAATAVAIQPDGKIVVTGNTGAGDGKSAFAVVRYNANGSLDTTFDGDGKAVVKVEDRAWAHSIALQKDGKIIVAGESYDTGWFSSMDMDFAVARLNPNGSLDRSFDGDGKKTIGFGGDETAYAVAIDYTGTPAANSNWGKIVLAGSHVNEDYRGYGVTRLNTNGSVDTTFNEANAFNRDGKLIATFDVAGGTELRGMLIQRDGKIVLTGTTGNASVYGAQQFVMVRLNRDGWFDRAFGDRGKVVTGFGGNDVAFDAVQSSDGGLIVGGTVNGKLALAGYTPAGQLNPRFGTGGRVKLDLGEFRSWEVGYGGLATAPGRKLVIAGGQGFGTARLLDNGGSHVFNPTLTSRPVVSRMTMSMNAPAKPQSTQPSANRASDLFSNERIGALMTL